MSVLLQVSRKEAQCSDSRIGPLKTCIGLLRICDVYQAAYSSSSHLSLLIMNPKLHNKWSMKLYLHPTWRPTFPLILSAAHWPPPVWSTCPGPSAKLAQAITLGPVPSLSHKTSHNKPCVSCPTKDSVGRARNRQSTAVDVVWRADADNTLLQP